MSEWEQTTLGHVVDINPEATPKTWEDELIRYVDIASVSREAGIALGALDPMPFNSAPGRARRRIRSRDVLVSTVRPNLRAFAVVPEALNGEVASTGFAVLRAKPGRILPEFMWSVVSSDAFVDAMVSRCTGTNYPAIRPADVASYTFSVPSPAEQRRIVDVVAAVDAQIDALNDEFLRLVPLRVRTFLDSDDLDHVRLDEIASVSQGKALPRRVQGERSGDVSWFKIADMNSSGNEDGYTRADTQLTPDQVKSLKGVLVPSGSVVFPRVGAAVLTEKKRILDVDAAVDENHLVLTPREGVPAECLLAAIESIRLSDLVQAGAVPSLNMGLIRRAQIPWSFKANDVMNSALAAIRASTGNRRAELMGFRAFRSSLLTSLLHQEIEIPESYDALLEGVS